MLLIEKTTQASALLIKLAGKRMTYFRLLKLLYIADRQAIREWGQPITFDQYVAMKHGPVLSGAYSAIKDETGPSYWHRYIARHGVHHVQLEREPECGALSQLEIDLLAKVHLDYLHKSQWVIRDELHEQCAEWKNPGNSSWPIEYEDILLALKIDEKRRDAMVKEYNSARAYFRAVALAEEKAASKWPKSAQGSRSGGRLASPKASLT